MSRLRVKTSRQSYPVEIGRDMGERLKVLTEKAVSRNKLFVFYDANFFALHGKVIRKELGSLVRRAQEMVIPSGEKYKSEATLASTHDFLLDNKVGRSDFILACGGGVTTDLVGYAAATVLRGVRWGAVPTTLLGMVDASIGGKTGINHSRGKNLIGSFWPPEFVLSDLEFLVTLEIRHMVAGLGETVKCAGLVGSKLVKPAASFIGGKDLFDLKALAPLVHRSAELKARIVSRDERESGPRRFLNFGHTFAHGIEKSLGYGRLLHGEAVILGLHAALNLGRALGYDSRGLRDYQGLVDRCMRLLPRRKLHYGHILSAMALDKKRSSAGMRFVLLERLGRPIIRDNVDRRLIKTALQSMIRAYRS